jgi:hypothetical protein
MKEIQLTRGKVAVVSNVDYRYLNQYKWRAFRNQSGNWYAIRSLWPSGKVIYMQREIANAPDGVEIDHKDGDGLHNWRRNLRHCNHSQNGGNAKINKNNTSGYRGVSWAKEVGKYVAQIKVNRKGRRLGYFDTREDAARVYNEAASKAFGKFARLNIIT